MNKDIVFSSQTGYTIHKNSNGGYLVQSPNQTLPSGPVLPTIELAKARIQVMEEHESGQQPTIPAWPKPDSLLR